MSAWWFCNHEWEVIRVDQTPGLITQNREINLSGARLDDRILLGVTNYVLRCPRCTRIKIKSRLGGSVEEVVVAPP